MRTVIAIAVAGGAGALARYGLDRAISRRASEFPWGTFVVNASGAFLLGLLSVLLARWLSPSHWLRIAVTVGFLGAYTTFSTLSFDTYRLLEDGSVGLAAANMLGSLVIGLLAVWGGISLGRAI